MEAVVLWCRQEALGRFPIGANSLEVGKASDCDIVVEDPDIEDRQWLLRKEQGTVMAYDLRARRGRAPKPQHVPLGKPLPVGEHHALVRVNQLMLREDVEPGYVETLHNPILPTTALELWIGRGPDARRLRIGSAPLHIGSDKGNDAVLVDRAVSGRHTRIERSAGRLRVRDLASHNGTYVDGTRVFDAELRVGSRLRIGKTDLFIVDAQKKVQAAVIATSKSMQRVFAEADRMATLSWPVLLLGETGVGKEVLAQHLHQQSSRAAKPFVALNAGGLARELVESELFGHEKGAFTGACNVHKGAFEQAQGGTLFLDEIGELPLELQARLLRVLESFQIRRVGAEHSIEVDVRVIMATHRNLQQMVSERRFRLDLLYRITRLILEIPALRERPDDIPGLATHFLQEARHEVGTRELSPAAHSMLLSYNWPGNVRELRNVVGMAALDCPSAVLDRDDICRAIERLGGHAHLEHAHPQALQQVLDQHRGNFSAAARALGIPRSTLRDRLKAAGRKCLR